MKNEFTPIEESNTHSTEEVIQAAQELSLPVGDEVISKIQEELDTNRARKIAIDGLSYTKRRLFAPE